MQNALWDPPALVLMYTDCLHRSPLKSKRNFAGLKNRSLKASTPGSPTGLADKASAPLANAAQLQLSPSRLLRYSTCHCSQHHLSMLNQCSHTMWSLPLGCPKRHLDSAQMSCAEDSCCRRYARWADAGEVEGNSCAVAHEGCSRSILVGVQADMVCAG